MDDHGIITVDVGTTSLRSALHDSSGKILHIEQRDNPPQCIDDVRIEQQPETWIKHLLETVRSCNDFAIEGNVRIAALSMTAQRSSVIPVDREGTPLHPAIMWQDTRTQDICDRMHEHQALVFNRTGLRIYPVFSAVKMTWLREELPLVYKATFKMLGVQDYLIHALTGEFVTDRSLASRTNLFNLHTLDWDDGLLGLFGMERDKLCQLIDPGSIAGTITAIMSTETGLPAGTPVVSAGGDQQCAALGLGLTGTGNMIANTGTGSYLITNVDHPILDPCMAISCNVAAMPGAYILEAASPTSGSIFRWFNREFYRDSPLGENDFTSIVSEAEASPPGSNGVLLMPHFKGRGAPRWDPRATGTFTGLRPGTTRGDMARAILEGIAADLAENLEAVEHLGGKVDSIAVAGGMAASSLYNQIQADHYARSVVRPEEKEATALGAWMSAAVSLDIQTSMSEAYRSATEGQQKQTYDPNPDIIGLYRAAGLKRKRIYNALRECDNN